LRLRVIYQHAFRADHSLTTTAAVPPSPPHTADGVFIAGTDSNAADAVDILTQDAHMYGNDAADIPVPGFPFSDGNRKTSSLVGRRTILAETG
jgi:hypothetical protein